MGFPHARLGAVVNQLLNGARLVPACVCKFIASGMDLADQVFQGAGFAQNGFSAGVEHGLSPAPELSWTLRTPYSAG